MMMGDPMMGPDPMMMGWDDGNDGTRSNDGMGPMMDPDDDGNGTNDGTRSMMMGPWIQ